jgi:hypothetical protein
MEKFDGLFCKTKKRANYAAAFCLVKQKKRDNFPISDLP